MYLSATLNCQQHYIIVLILTKVNSKIEKIINFPEKLKNSYFICKILLLYEKSLDNFKYLIYYKKVGG